MKVLAFGEILRDVYPDSSALGGASLNFCAHCIKCGADGYILSAIGKDEAGDLSLAEVRAMGINTEFVEISDKPTGLVTVTLNEKMIPTYRIVENSAYDFISCDDELIKRIADHHFDAFYFGSLAQRNPVSKATVTRVLKECHFDNIFCDINLRDNCYNENSVLTCFENATILKFSDEEEPRLRVFDFWRELMSDSVEKLMENIFDKYSQLKFILFTKGADGAEIYQRGKPVIKVAAEGDKVVSTVGAGDSFGAAWLTTYFLTGSPEKSAKIASKVSGIVVSFKEAVPNYNLNELL